MIKAIIVEDEFGSRESLKAILHEYIKDVTILAEATNIKEAVDVLNEYQPDIVFMDIRLPDGDSFRILDHFPEAEFEVIFITAYSDYLQKAFDYFSFQYLTKPVDIEKLEKTMTKFRQNQKPAFSNHKLNRLEDLLGNKTEILTIPHSDGIRILPIPDIVRLEADGSYTVFVLENGDTFMSTKGLGHYEKALESYSFFRTHKSHLVNVKMISNVSFHDGILLKNKERIPLAQRNKKRFIDYLRQA